MNRLFFLVFLALVGCFPVNYQPEIKVPFTTNIKEKLEKAGQDITKVQFYNSDDIVLRRELSSGEAKVNSGKIEIIDGKYIETILIKAETPGVCESYTDKSLTISFEQGKHLIFSTDGNSNLFKISANDWKNNFGIVNYGDNRYYILPQSSNVSLLVEKKQIVNVTEQTKIVTGRTINNN